MSRRGVAAERRVACCAMLVALAAAMACGDGIGRPLVAVIGGSGGIGGAAGSQLGGERSGLGGTAGTSELNGGAPPSSGGSAGKQFGGNGPWTGGYGARFGQGEWLGGAARSFNDSSAGDFGRADDFGPFDGEGDDAAHVRSRIRRSEGVLER